MIEWIYNKTRLCSSSLSTHTVFLGQTTDNGRIKSLKYGMVCNSVECTMLPEEKWPATEGLFATESPRRSRPAPGTSSSLERQPVQTTTATHTWGRGASCRRRVDGRRASSSSDGTDRRSGRGHPWRCAVRGRCTDTRRTHTRPGLDRAGRTSAQRSRCPQRLSTGKDHSPEHYANIINFKCNLITGILIFSSLH